MHPPVLAGIDLQDVTTPVPDLLHLDVATSAPDLEMVQEESLRNQRAGVQLRLHPALAHHLAVLPELRDLHLQGENRHLCLPAWPTVLSAVDPGLARQSLLAVHNPLIRGTGAGYMENVALCPVRVHRGQIAGQ